MSTFPKIKFRDGELAPGLAFGIGTAWFGKDATDVVKTALSVGYLHLDNAEAYGNEAACGKAIKESGVDPSKLYITTKFGAGMKDVTKAIDESLAKLGVDSVSLALLHWPYDFVKPEFPSMEDAWKGMCEIKKAGKAKSIGVSNFRQRDLEKIVKSKPAELPVINQIEFHPFVAKATRDLADYCKQHDIKLAAYGPTTPITKFGGGGFDPVLEKVTKAVSSRTGRDVQASQVLLKWVAQQGVLVVTTSGKDWRMKEQLAAYGIADLTNDEMDELVEAAKPEPQRAFMKHMDDHKTEY
ncbi:hypothetical protein JCM10212_004333 [Sporobolomyces blumeae]